MASMTQQALSDCSYPESDIDDIQSQIERISDRLTLVIKEETGLRHDLEKLLNKQEEDALKAVKKAEENLEKVRQQRSRIKLQFSRDETRSDTGDHSVQEFATNSTQQLSDSSSIKPSDEKDASEVEHEIPAPESEINLVPKEFKDKYGGNKIALGMVASLEAKEKQLLEYNNKLLDEEESMRTWEEIQRKCKTSGQTDLARDAGSSAGQARSLANRHRTDARDVGSTIKYYRDLLFHLEVKEEAASEPVSVE